MKFEDFQLLDEEPFDNSIMKRIFLKYTINKERNWITQIKILNLFPVKTTIIIKQGTLM